MKHSSCKHLAHPAWPWALVLWALTAPASAQSQALPAGADITRLRPPGLPLPSVPKVDLRLETPERSPVPRAVDELQFVIRKVQVDGASQYPAADVERLFADLLDRPSSLEEVRVRAERLEARYRADGFFLVRVLIPPQQLREGVIRVQVIEGFVESVLAQGGTPAMREKVEQIMAGLTRRRPIDLASLESQLLQLNDVPGLAGSGVLRAGRSLGASELVIDLQDSAPTQTTFSLNNHASNLIGPWGLNASTVVENLFGGPDRLSAGLSSSLDDRLFAVNANYAWPLGIGGVVASVGALKARARPGGAIRDQELRSDSQSLTARLRHALVKSRHASLYLEAGLAVNQSDTRRQGLMFDQMRHTVADLTLLGSGTWVQGGQTQARLGLHRGLTALGAFGKGDPRAVVLPAFEPRFEKWVFSLDHVQAMSAHTSLALSLKGQRSGDVLVSGEQLSFGGLGIGRGYDGGAIAGRQGHGVSAELRWSVPGESLAPWPALKSLQAFVFIDGARVEPVNPADAGAQADTLASHGAGLRMSLAGGWMAELMVAKARRALREPAADARADPRWLLLISRSF